MKISDFNETSPYELAKRWTSKKIQPRQYEKAAETLHNVLVKKSRENNINHSLGYYAQQIGKSFAGIDYKALVDYYKEHYGSEGLAEFKIVKPDPKDTLGIKRAEMPQIATQDYPQFIDYLKDKGAKFSKATVDPRSLKAIQGEFSDQGVEKALNKRDIKKPCIVSSDNYIIDGHHRWLVALNTATDIDIFRVDIPGKQLLQLVKDFPKTTYKDIYTEAEEVIPMLYHATYKPFLDSIMKNGLGGSGAQTQWEDSKPGYVYLAKDPEVAVSHAEANEEVPDEYIDNIVVLSIDASQLDQDNLEDDPNVIDDDSTLAYKGIIPTSAFSVKDIYTEEKKSDGKLINPIPALTNLKTMAKPTKYEKRKAVQFEPIKPEIKENFKDGKKPGRKGLAKRVGVDCAKSVSELRKIAKNSSGERARMAHWCANMKSGRKKTTEEESLNIDEGWKSTLGSLAIAAGLTAGSLGALTVKQALDSPSFSKSEKVEIFNKANLPSSQLPADLKVSTPEPRPSVDYKPLTNSKNEQVLLQAAKANGIQGIELAAFMAQMAHESENFKDMVEDNPNIKKYATGRTAKTLGNKSSNDAERFIGRGFIQLTGRWNYEWMQKNLGIDLTSTWSAAHKASNPKIAAKIAVEFWKQRVRPNVTDFTNVAQVTKPINSNLHGLEHREQRFAQLSKGLTNR